jgi:hypothetical protein
MTPVRIVYVFFVCTLLLLTTASVTVSPAESELARLMRQMLNYIKTEKQRIETGAPMQPAPKSFYKMTNAKVTPGKQISNEHETYASNFLEQLKSYQQTTPANRKEVFNTMIQTCITCHKRECPGPIQTIEQNILQ